MRAMMKEWETKRLFASNITLITSTQPQMSSDLNTIRKRSLSTLFKTYLSSYLLTWILLAWSHRIASRSRAPAAALHQYFAPTQVNATQPSPPFTDTPQHELLPCPPPLRPPLPLLQHPSPPLKQPPNPTPPLRLAPRRQALSHRNVGTVERSPQQPRARHLRVARPFAPTKGVLDEPLPSLAGHAVSK